MIRDPAYQIIPGKESVTIDLTDLRSNLWQDGRAKCFDITLKAGDIWISDGVSSRNLNYPIIKIDGTDSVLTNTPTEVAESVSIFYNASLDNPQVQGINWDADRVYIYLKFNLAQLPAAEASAFGCDYSIIPGSRFLHTTFVNDIPVNPFSYNYTESRVTQPDLRDAVLEVAVW
jgi:hypothetical protein